MKEKLQAKLKLLENNRDQLLANLNATNGAIQICQDLLRELEKEEKVSIVDAAIMAAESKPQ